MLRITFRNAIVCEFIIANPLCENVMCGGHFLCSVGANGHEKIVRPQRIGYRNGNLIICRNQVKNSWTK